MSVYVVTNPPAGIGLPRHETCPTPLDYSTEPAGEAVHAERENPFAALQALKTRREG